MTAFIGRREFITLLGGAAAAWPLAARAQQPAMPVVGFLELASDPTRNARLVAAFRQGLNEAGYIEGQNVAIEYRWAEGQYDRLPALAAELVALQVDVIVASGTSGSPCRQGGHHDDSDRLRDWRRPGRSGLVRSLNRPGGNVTGITFLARARWRSAGAATRARSATPLAVGCLSDPANPSRIGPNARRSRSAGAVARAASRCSSKPATRAKSKQPSQHCATPGRRRSSSVPIRFSISHRDQIVALAARYRFPPYIRRAISSMPAV